MSVAQVKWRMMWSMTSVGSGVSVEARGGVTPSSVEMRFMEDLVVNAPSWDIILYKRVLKWIIPFGKVTQLEARTQGDARATHKPRYKASRPIDYEDMSMLPTELMHIICSCLEIRRDVSLFMAACQVFNCIGAERLYKELELDSDMPDSVLLTRTLCSTTASSQLYASCVRSVRFFADADTILSVHTDKSIWRLFQIVGHLRSLEAFSMHFYYTSRWAPRRNVLQPLEMRTGYATAQQVDISLGPMPALRRLQLRGHIRTPRFSPLHNLEELRVLQKIHSTEKLSRILEMVDNSFPRLTTLELHLGPVVDIKVAFDIFTREMPVLGAICIHQSGIDPVDVMDYINRNVAVLPSLAAMSINTSYTYFWSRDELSRVNYIPYWDTWDARRVEAELFAVLLQTTTSRPAFEVIRVGVQNYRRPCGTSSFWEMEYAPDVELEETEFSGRGYGDIGTCDTPGELSYVVMSACITNRVCYMSWRRRRLS
ncbi:hypothetical protein DFP72DRAFT_856849 [Ephemerocybe angulata]|uniref:F-box domain-containing protein n=1 Tax=Ephemerocybe angulata TaxID=980116 RepID=A0A8H6HEX7_9AGAR|nr:hypothetical protein DFP72DRAFT_856849 [Tulosesus angulatus]